MMPGVLQSGVMQAREALRGGSRRPFVSDEDGSRYLRHSGSPMPELADPFNPSNELSPSDFINPPPDHESPQAQRLVQMVLRDLKADQQAKMVHFPEMFNSWTFRQGKHWRTWNANGGWESMITAQNRGGKDSPFIQHHRTYNKISPLADKAIEKMLASAEDVTFGGMATDQDIVAAKEARSYWAHVQRQNKFETLKFELADWAYSVGVPLLHPVWNPYKKAIIPLLGPNGQILKTFEAEVGDTDLLVVSPFEWFCDGKAKNFYQCTRLNYVTVHPLEYVQKRYKVGWTIYADAYATDETGTDLRIDEATGNWMAGQDRQANGVKVIERWEPDSSRFEGGRLMTVINNKLASYAEELPDGAFSFHPCYYAKTLASTEGRNGVSGAIDAQIFFSKAMNRTEEHVDEATYFIMAEEGSEPSINMARSDGIKMMAFWKNANGSGIAPNFQVTPPLPEEYATAMEAADAFIRDYMGVHLISDSQLPADQLSGIALKWGQRGDDLGITGFIRNFNDMLVGAAEDVIKIGSKRLTDPNVPRMVMVADTRSLAETDPRALSMTFRNLSAGRVVVEPGPAAVKDPIVAAQMIFDLGAKGFLDVDRLPSTIALLGVMQIENPTKVADDLRTALQQILAQQPSPAQIEQQKHQQSMEQIQLQGMLMEMKANIEAKLDAQHNQFKAQSASEMQNAKLQRQAEMEDRKSVNEMQKAERLAEIDAHTEIIIAQTKALIDQQSQRVEQQGAERLEQLKGSVKIMVEEAFRSMIPALAPAVPDPQGTVEIEKMHGVDGAVPPPPKPVGASPGANAQ